ncbi:MAG: nucleotidyltransferase domain-containing protein [Gemmatimonadetes bacterium]|nr:nucleotidyltransferase domain-containing protein [Gemmatimonadota bacterium]
MTSPGGGGSEPTEEIVLRAASRFAGDLVGIVAFGSWARGEAADGSDVDVLVVVAPSVPLTRGLYREWDDEPLSWRGRPVEAHFVHIPDPGESPSSLWAEAALDGVVLFERGLALSRRLAAMRRRIAAGQLSRRRIHGQPYWVGGR